MFDRLEQEICFKKPDFQQMVAKFGLPVIDGVSSEIKLAEALISVKTSKIGGYAYPLRKHIKVLCLKFL